MCVGGAADAGEKDFRSGRLDRPHTLGDSEFCEGGGVEPDHLGLIDGEKVAAAGPVVDDERVDGTDLGVPGQDLGDTSRLVKRENLRT